MRKACLLVFLFVLAGCAAMPAEQTLGLKRREADGQAERLVSAFVLRHLPARGKARGFEVIFPEELRKAAMIGASKAFTVFSGEEIHLTRKAIQGKITASDKDISVYISPRGIGYASSQEDVHAITLYAPDGAPFVIAKIRGLSESELQEVYENVEKEFPYLSQPIEGSGERLHFGREAIVSLQVPQTVTFGERAAASGLATVRVSPNIVGEAISKAAALIQTHTLSPVSNGLALSEKLKEDSVEEEIIGDK